MGVTLPREWLEVQDPEDEDNTYHFDITFLLSNYHCIYNNGCKGCSGTPANGCCETAAYFEDEQDVQKVAKHVKRLKPGDADNYNEIQKRWYVTEGKEFKTRVIKGKCIFLNREGGCSLHRKALEAGEDYRTWKPHICGQAPLDLSYEDYGTVITGFDPEDTWGKGENAWWCTSDPIAYSSDTYTYRSFRLELITLCGEKVYNQLVKVLDARVAALAVPPRGVPVFIGKPGG
jgi:hypothetical protein